MITEYIDKNGKPIYTGDVVMHQLGSHAKKSGGPSYYSVVRSGRNIAFELINTKYRPLLIKFRPSDMRFVTITDTRYREDDEKPA